MKNITILFIVSFFGMSVYADNEVPVDPVAPEASSSSRSCTDNRQRIKEACSRNPTMQSQLDDQGNVAAVADGQNTGGGTAEELLLGQSTGKVAQGGLNSAKEQCLRAGDSCKASCEQERDQANQKYGQLSSNPMTQAQAQQEKEKALRFNRYNDECSQEVQQAVAKMDKGLGDIGQMLAGIAQLLQALGIGQGAEGGDIAEASTEDEGCEGANASLLIECAGVSDPVGSRAGVSGATGVGDLSGGSGQSLFGQAAEADTGGDRDKAAKAAGNGFQNNSLGGGFGSGSAPGSGVSAASSDKEKLDADIYKGYMGGGGSGGFGSFSGGGGGGGLSFGKSSGSSVKSAAYGRKKLQSALDKAVGSRNPASMETTNGPYQNIWGVVSKTYKKTSSSMFHKE